MPNWEILMKDDDVLRKRLRRAKSGSVEVLVKSPSKPAKLAGRISPVQLLVPLVPRQLSVLPPENTL